MSWHFVGRNLLTTSSPDSVMSQAGELMLVLGIGTLAAAPLVLVAYAYMSAVTSLYVSDITLGRTPHTGSIQRRVLASLPGITIVIFLVVLRALGGLAIGFGLLLLSALLDSQGAGASSMAPVVALLGVVGIIGGVVLFFVFAARDLLAPVIMLQEGAKPLTSLRRSRTLSASGSGVMGLLFVTLLIQLLLWGSLQLPAGLLQDYLLSQGVASGNLVLKVLYSLLSSFGAYASFLLVHPVFIAGVTVVYFDRRVRGEGFDIELLAQDIWKKSRAVDFEL
jgi:hypothetical protein